VNRKGRTPPDPELTLDLFGAPDEERADEGSGRSASPDARPPAAVGPASAEPGAARSAGAASAPAAPPEPKIWSVSEINSAVRALLEDTLPSIWIGGEVTNWTRARSGHCYFTLKDDRAQIRCVIWRRDAAQLPTDPEEGMKVRAFGSLTLYEARGEYQFGVRQLEGEGSEGLWRLAFERLRAKLDAEGLLAPERKRRLPRFPECVGVVTSPTGAALHDILTVIRRRAPWTRVTVRGARVQGEGAAEEVAEAIRVLGGSGRVQVMIVGRGGGSIEDLWAFNHEAVARAIAACPVPVVSAVGHEVDVTISDLVADLRAPTPSAAAEAVVQDREALLELLRTVRPRLARNLHTCVERRQGAVRERKGRLEGAIRRVVEPRRARVTDRLAGMDRAIRKLVHQRRHDLLNAAGKIEALSPLSTLRRGYAVPLGPQGKLLRRVEDFEPGLRFSLRVVDGRIECTAGEHSRDEGIGG
jgi:exodeoxyribonuclease VII large subunit